jgi:hypothetical protein
MFVNSLLHFVDNQCTSGVSKYVRRKEETSSSEVVVGSHFGLRYFGPAKLVKERVASVVGEKGSRFPGILTAQAEKKWLTVTWSTGCKRCPFLSTL